MLCFFVSPIGSLAAWVCGEDGLGINGGGMMRENE